jgi:hypothetical protein
MLGKYQKICENRQRFQANFQFEYCKVSPWVVPYIKLNCMLFYKVRTNHLKLIEYMFMFFGNHNKV